MSNNPYKKTWSEEFNKGWSEGYTTALDDVNHNIKKILERHYEGENHE
jgi:hypothetical protein